MGSELEGQVQPLTRLFVVTLSHGLAWNASLPLEEQTAWTAHAAFMDAMFAEGLVLLGGPLEGASGALLIMRARGVDEVRQRLTGDPWMRLGLLHEVSITPWTLRLGAL